MPISRSRRTNSGNPATEETSGSQCPSAEPLPSASTRSDKIWMDCNMVSMIWAMPASMRPERTWYRPKCMETGGQSSDRHETWAWNSSQLIPVPYFGAPLPSSAPSSTGDGLAGLQCPALINEPGAGFPLFM